ncbi:MAG: hypothetical protein ACI4OX_01335, partial [Akkermansia sp.]
RGGESLLLFTPNVKLIFAKFGKKVQKDAKKCQKRAIFGKIGTILPARRQHLGKTPPKKPEKRQNAPIARARKRTQAGK